MEWTSGKLHQDVGVLDVDLGGQRRRCMVVTAVDGSLASMV